MSKALTILLAPMLMILLSASSCLTPQVVVKTRTEYVGVPEELLHCSTRPTPPGPGAFKYDWSDYTFDLHQWGADCEGKLGSTRDWVHKHAGAR